MDNQQYRSDIDGMRAIAVIAVVIFHINPQLLPGGFLGVDMFFVLSGYLITQLLLKDISRTGRVDYVRFYRRRAQRLLPALLLMLTVTSVVSFIILAPNDFFNYAQSLFAALFSASNIYAYLFVDTSYFASDSAELPLLHLWSLGVEEQFYFIWPLALSGLVCHRYVSQYRLAIVVAVALLSLLLAQWLLSSFLALTYYMLPTRAWQLMAGGALALAIDQGYCTRLGKSTLLSMAMIGLLLIFSSLFLIDEGDAIPGFGALPAVLGVVLLLASGTTSQTVVHRYLASTIMAGIGLISYSAYLWHWPLLALMKYAFIEITITIGIAAFLLTFALAQLSYYLVEQPLRVLTLPTRQVFVRYFFVPTVALSIVAVGFTFIIRYQLNYFYSWDAYKAAIDIKPAWRYQYNCQYTTFNASSLTESRCVYPEKEQPKVLLLGDSNAAHYLGMLRVFAQEYNFSIRNITVSSCPILFLDQPIDWPKFKVRENCQHYRDQVKPFIQEFDTVIIGGAWTSYEKHGGQGFRDDLAKSIEHLSSQVNRVIVLARIPYFAAFNSECEIRRVRLPHLECSPLRFSIPTQNYAINRFIEQQTVNHENAYYFDPRNELCDEKHCTPYLGGFPVYYDEGHYSLLGSKLIGEAMIRNNNPMLSVFKGLGGLEPSLVKPVRTLAQIK
ncbi:acyltransferase family protein [Psychrobium sp. 1_MG-2023]|uniref:acyltransferase family protein n=1 Tax=Psychrobium sp. 1_MG-2023 TaxID=3062624 RepID=UPI000C336C17|nr:acyltransferase family protein [Psychrobium sp. 1_MG-2023]MDP2560390.1 acyltransferase family protein [Psychrobium sp. 1_MG-2023]PKF57941.1 hypothetical protein CW748_05315 [Alteromonadales bacterium alter-6D02]